MTQAVTNRFFIKRFKKICLLTATINYFKLIKMYCFCQKHFPSLINEKRRKSLHNLQFYQVLIKLDSCDLIISILRQQVLN